MKRPPKKKPVQETKGSIEVWGGGVRFCGTLWVWGILEKNLGFRDYPPHIAPSPSRKEKRAHTHATQSPKGVPGASTDHNDPWIDQDEPFCHHTQTWIALLWKGPCTTYRGEGKPNRSSLFQPFVPVV